MFRRYFHGQHANYLPVCVCSRGQAVWTTKRTERELIIPPLQLSFWGLQPIRFHVLFNYLVKSISGSWTKALFSPAPRQWEELILMCDNPSWQNTKLEKHLERTDLRQAARFPTYTCNCWRACRVCCPEHFSKRVRLSRVKCFCPKYKTAAELFTSKKPQKPKQKSPVWKASASPAHGRAPAGQLLSASAVELQACEHVPVSALMLCCVCGASGWRTVRVIESKYGCVRGYATLRCLWPSGSEGQAAGGSLLPTSHWGVYHSVLFRQNFEV